MSAYIKNRISFETCALLYALSTGRLVDWGIVSVLRRIDNTSAMYGGEIQNLKKKRN